MTTTGYSIPESCPLVHNMEKVLSTEAMSTQNKRRRVLQADGSSSVSVSSAVALQERIYVKPVALHPARGKHLHGSAASVSWLKHGDIAVSLHATADGTDIDMDAKWVGGRPYMCVLRVPADGVDDVVAQMSTHTCAKHILYTLPGVPSLPDIDIVRDVVNSGAW